MKQRQDWSPKLWLRILLPTVLVVIWLAVSGIGGTTFGKIAEVSTNDQAGFLPSSAESTEVNNIQADFRDSENIPAVIIIEKDSGEIAPDEFADFATLTDEIPLVAGVAEAVEGESPSVVGPIPAEDGEAIQYLVFLDAEGEELRDTVKELRELVQDEIPAGFTAYVSGPAGFLADLVAGFGGIDGILLAVTLLAVLVILLIVYRSLLLPVLVLLTSVFALSGSILGIYYLALFDIIKVSGQSQGILSILVIGAATDYSLLLVARYREALFEVESKWAAIGRALRGAFEPILASAGTVIAALLLLLLSDLNSNKALGPIVAFGIIFAYLSAMTLLPALLVIFGRAAFWPFVPRPGKNKVVVDAGPTIPGLEGIRGLWKKVGTLVARRPRTVWVATLVLLLIGAAALPSFKANGVPQTEFLLGDNIESVEGQEALARHFDAGSGAPVIIISDEEHYEAVMDATAEFEGVTEVTVLPDLEALPEQAAAPADVTAQGGPPADAAAQGGPPADVASQGGPPADATAQGGPPAELLADLPPLVSADGRVLIEATIDFQPDSADAEELVKQMRTDLVEVDPNVLVGGETAIALDTNETAQADLFKIIPLVLLVILIILIFLLRSILTPVLLVATTVVSFATALGVAALVFNNIFGFPGADASVPLFGFVFLVALGIDYNIFLMTRAREESLKIGTRPGVLRALAVTGGVITSAGIVLAATFAALAVIPILFLAQLAFIVSFGVLLDTIIVRSLLVPALVYDIGPKSWWPNKLSRNDPAEHGTTPAVAEEPVSAPAAQ